MDQRPLLLASVDDVQFEHGLVVVRGSSFGSDEAIALTPEAAVDLAMKMLRALQSNNIVGMADYRRREAVS